MNTNTKPRLIVTERAGLATTTMESRRGMSSAQLIELMGNLHVSHKDYKPRPRSLLPTPNLAGKQPVVEGYRCGILDELRRALWL